MIFMLFVFLILLSLMFILQSEKPSKILNKQLCNAVSLYTNQQKQSVVAGMIDLSVVPNPNVFSCRYYHASATLKPGEGVILTDRGSDDSEGPPIVTKRAADGNAVFGVMVFNPKQATISSGDILTVAAKGSVIWMEASAAIARGASVALVLASPSEIVTRTTETIFGTALDKAAADGDLIRVLVA